MIKVVKTTKKSTWMDAKTLDHAKKSCLNYE